MNSGALTKAIDPRNTEERAATLFFDLLAFHKEGIVEGDSQASLCSNFVRRLGRSLDADVVVAAKSRRRSGESRIQFEVPSEFRYVKSAALNRPIVQGLDAVSWRLTVDVESYGRDASRARVVRAMSSRISPVERLASIALEAVFPVLSGDQLLVAALWEKEPAHLCFLHQLGPEFLSLFSQMSGVREERDEIVHSVEAWADSHPSPDSPLLLIGRDSYSPRQIAHEVRTRTALGSEVKRLLVRSAIARVLPAETGTP